MTNPTYVLASRGIVATSIAGKCDNPKCSNFTTNCDLSGHWCCCECFVEFEFDMRPSEDDYKEHFEATTAYKGFPFRCKEHNFYLGSDDSCKVHAVFEHDDGYVRIKNWRAFFTLFEIGDCLSSFYRCKKEGWEFFCEADARKHITEYHGVTIDES